MEIDLSRVWYKCRHASQLCVQYTFRGSWCVCDSCYLRKPCDETSVNSATAARGGVARGSRAQFRVPSASNSAASHLRPRSLSTQLSFDITYIIDAHKCLSYVHLWRHYRMQMSLPLWNSVFNVIRERRYQSVFVIMRYLIVLFSINVSL